MGESTEKETFMIPNDEIKGNTNNPQRSQPFQKGWNSKIKTH